MCTARSINSSSQVDLLAWHKQQWKHPASLLYSWRSSQTRGIIEGATSILRSSMFQIACPEKTARPRGISQQGIHQCMVTFRELNYLWRWIFNLLVHFYCQVPYPSVYEVHRLHPWSTPGLTASAHTSIIHMLEHDNTPHVPLFESFEVQNNQCVGYCLGLWVSE